MQIILFIELINYKPTVAIYEFVEKHVTWKISFSVLKKISVLIQVIFLVFIFKIPSLFFLIF